MLSSMFPCGAFSFSRCGCGKIVAWNSGKVAGKVTTVCSKQAFEFSVNLIVIC